MDEVVVKFPGVWSTGKQNYDVVIRFNLSVKLLTQRGVEGRIHGDGFQLLDKTKENIYPSLS